MLDPVNRWEIRKIMLSDVKMMSDNPRTIKDKALAGLEGSIERFGYVEPIVWNEETGNIVGGHQRYSILVDHGVEEANMLVVRLSADEEMAANMTLNNPKIEGTWDDPITDLLKQVEEASSDLFSVLNLDELKESLEKSSDNPGNNSGGIDLNSPEPVGDTECPCCAHKWDVANDDISTETR